MRLYLLSAAVGLGVGALYGLLNVRSPAPPVVALVGLFAMLAGEQLVPWLRARWIAPPSADNAQSEPQARLPDPPTILRFPERTASIPSRDVQAAGRPVPTSSAAANDPSPTSRGDRT